MIYLYIVTCLIWKKIGKDASISYFGMEGRAHDVVVMTGQNRDARAALPVPDADRLRRRKKHTQTKNKKYMRAGAFESKRQRLANIRANGSASINAKKKTDTFERKLGNVRENRQKLHRKKKQRRCKYMISQLENINVQKPVQEQQRQHNNSDAK